MPCECRDFPSNEPALEAYINELTQNLCFLCGELEGAGLIGQFASERIKAWWKQHQFDDTDRVSKKMESMYPMSAEDQARKLIDAAEKVHPVSEFHKKWFYILAEKVWKERDREEKAEKAKRVASLKKELEDLEAEGRSPT